ncbi:MAG: hypothetical protein EOO11_19195 [Chitinophagaceae bacterium]|nr:MAG: hypothetical protein EOO11_19195 [Chitinophagaceae bacterium]
MHPDLELLQAENRRLSALVAALAEKNLRLEEALSRHNGPQTPLHIPVSSLYVPATELPVQTSPVTGPSTEVTVPSNQLAGTSGKVSVPSGQLPVPAREVAVPSVPLPGRSGPVGVPTDPLTAAAQLPPDLQLLWERTWGEAQYRARLLRLYEAKLPEEAVCAALHHGPMAGCRETHVADGARLLLWLCGQVPERVSYARLHSVTGLTDSGNNKLLASLRKRGLIRWKSFQVYEVAEKAALLLEELLPRQ